MRYLIGLLCLLITVSGFAQSTLSDTSSAARNRLATGQRDVRLVPRADGGYQLVPITRSAVGIIKTDSNAVVGLGPKLAIHDLQNLRMTQRTAGSVSVLEYGAVGDGSTDDRVAIQNAINSAATEITIPAGYTFVVSLNGSLSTPEGGTGIGLNLPSNKTLWVLGTIKLKGSTVGNSSAIISNTSAITNAHIYGPGTIDGNRSGTTGTTINICLFNARDCTVENVTSINSTYGGVWVRNTTTGYGPNLIRNCVIKNIGYIGIQAAKADNGITIDGNRIRDCVDNGIDIEGNNASGDPGIGRNILVTRNIIIKTGNGLFLESGNGATVSLNLIDSSSANAIIQNRINSGSFGNKFVSNVLKNTPTGYGINFNSYVGDADVVSNTFENFRSSMYFNGGATRVYVGPNTHKNISKYLVEIYTSTNSSVKNVIDRQLYQGSQSGGYPETTSPITNALNNSARAYLTSVTPAYSLESGTAFTGFIRQTTATASNSGWGAYSIYFSSETRQWFPTNPPTVGDYVKINNVLFLVYSNPNAGEYVLRSSAGAAGNYTSTTNGAYSVTDYFPAYMTD